MWSAMRISFVGLLAALAVIHSAGDALADIASTGTVQAPITGVKNSPGTMHVVESNWTSLSDVLDVYSARNLVRNWAEGEYPSVGAQCSKDITTYAEALKNKELWALKGTKVKAASHV